MSAAIAPRMNHLNDIDPHYANPATGSLKRYRSNHSANSDTSDGHPWTEPECQPAVNYDFGNSFGYEVFLQQIAADEHDELCLDALPSQVENKREEEEGSALPKAIPVLVINRRESHVFVPLSFLSVSEVNQPTALKGADLVSGPTIEEAPLDGHSEDEEDEDSGSDTDSDGYESDFSYFPVPPPSVAPIVSRTVQVLVVDDSAVQRKVSRVQLSGKVSESVGIAILSILLSFEYTLSLDLPFLA